MEESGLSSDTGPRIPTYLTLQGPPKDCRKPHTPQHAGKCYALQVHYSRTQPAKGQEHPPSLRHPHHPHGSGSALWALLSPTSPTRQRVRTETEARLGFTDRVQLRPSPQLPELTRTSLPLFLSGAFLSLGTWVPLILPSWEVRCSRPWKNIIFTQSLLKPTLDEHKLFKRPAGLQQVSWGTLRSSYRPRPGGLVTTN